MPVGILHRDGAGTVRRAHADRRTARRDDARATLLERRERRVDVADHQDDGRRAGVLVAPAHRLPIDVGELDELDAAADAGLARLDEPQPRAGQAMQVEVSRVGVPRQRPWRRRRHQIHAQQVVVETG
jgi:hypothetical protein